MELRHLRYFVAIAEEQHYGRAARRLGVAQPALSRQITNLEQELGFEVFERLPRGVRLSAAGRCFLEDARRVLDDLEEAAARAARVADGFLGTLRVGFAENASWHGVVPESFRWFREQQRDVELHLQPMGSVAQLEAIRSGQLDAGFVHFFMPNVDRELALLHVATHHVELAMPKGHALTKLKKLRLGDLTDIPIVWFPRSAGPEFYDQLMHQCFLRGLRSPRIVQVGLNEATILGLVSTGLGVGWVLDTARWRRPETVVIAPLADLQLSVTMSLVWRKDNSSPSLANFISHVRRLPVVRELRVRPPDTPLNPN